MHLQPYGGKTGRAMIKYPHIRKNAQGLFTHAYPASKPCQTTVSTCMRSQMAFWLIVVAVSIYLGIYVW